MGAIGRLEICSDLVDSGETVLRWLQRLVWLGYVTMYLEHQNFAISAEAGSGSEFIVSRAKEAYDIRTSV